MGTVVIAGAGPVGLMLARELSLAGVEVVLLDKAPQRSGESRAFGIQPRTMEVLEQRGILDEFIAAGRVAQMSHFAGLLLDFTALHTRHPATLILPQTRTESILEAHLRDVGVSVRWSAEVVGVEQDEHGVTVEVRGADGTIEQVAADYLVGCDGGRSAVRKLLGIDFPGTPGTLTAMLGDLELADPPEHVIYMQRSEYGQFSVLHQDTGAWRVMTVEYDRVTDRNAPMSLDDLRTALVRMAGTDFGMNDPHWLSRFTDSARQAADYRRGRVLLAGDAAHIHHPSGGQGLNLGVQDAVILGWKLALVCRGQAPDELLDSYMAERHPVAERVVENTRAQTALSRPDRHTEALREVFTHLIGFTEVNQYLSGMISALDLRYPIGDPATRHPLVGHRVPDADLKTTAGDTRVFTLLHKGRGVLLCLDPDATTALAEAAGGWLDRADVVSARTDPDAWSIPIGGVVPAPAAVLVRPDGYVAWTGTDPASLRAALGTWFGPAH
jgi:2-polyprenyl-6-methoxyphenol hydroxylase-like FAD-dependent oxidoreductase